MVKGESDLVYRNLANKYYQLTQGRSKYITDPIEAISAALWVLASDESEAQGTGFMLKDWGLITCHHVLSKGMYAFRHDNVLKKYNFSIIYENKDIDLAVLKIDSADVVHYLDSSAQPILPYHADVTIAGFPNYYLGHAPYIAPGKVVSSRKIHGIEMITINAPIVHGNSGGPVLDADGKVVGVASSGGDIERTDFFGYIPINNLQHLLT